MALEGRKLLLGVTGSIAAYKAAELVRLLKKAGAEVQVLMTPDAARFIPPLTLGTLSEREVLVEIFPENAEGSWTKHVSLGLWADLFVVAPATAQTVAKLAHGFCDTMLTATALAARCPLLVCPAMDHDMYLHPATQANLERLRAHGAAVMTPGYGELASGLVGHGRMPEPEAILARIGEALAEDPATTPLAGRHVLVTAGPTREPIDPVRVITNPSTGTMGYAMAAAATRRGARVTLVSGPTALETPSGAERIDVTTAEEMHAAVQAHAGADLVIMTAAVADYTPADPAAHKLKKSDGGEALTLRLRRTPDILAGLGAARRDGQILVGFAMETDDALANARRKLEAKNLDFIVLNDLHEPGAGFGTGTNRVTLLRRGGGAEVLPLMPKHDLAETLLDRIVRVFED
ncbi:MAG: bifunctional phosphopantothenoylcysteine decarboxylase/phosphopantothenate--cysteine ligase CoaBC [Rhodothermales bacterium]|nr:bifunctional phosphopantothenoylcysteine decarboxylase/phosphopantothenate--cysteine ligase CoaBC [Rhodothermales bacterium]